MINHLEEDETKAYSNLPNELVEYEDLEMDIKARAAALLAALQPLRAPQRAQPCPLKAHAKRRQPLPAAPRRRGWPQRRPAAAAANPRRNPRQDLNETAYRLALWVAILVLSNFILSCMILFKARVYKYYYCISLLSMFLSGNPRCSLLRFLSRCGLGQGDQGNPNWVYNVGSRTTTGLLTNTMLVSTRVYGYLSYARTSRDNGWAISLFSVIPTSYNAIDENAKLPEAKPDDNA